MRKNENFIEWYPEAIEKAFMWLVGRAHPNKRVAEIMIMRALKHVGTYFRSEV